MAKTVEIRKKYLLYILISCNFTKRNFSVYTLRLVYFNPIVEIVSY